MRACETLHESEWEAVEQVADNINSFVVDDDDRVRIIVMGPNTLDVAKRIAALLNGKSS